MSTWRRYTYTPPGGRVRNAHELIVRDPGPPGAVVYQPACELDGRAIGREAAAWVLGRWRTGGRGAGAALWVTRYGRGAPPMRCRRVLFRLFSG